LKTARQHGQLLVGRYLNSRRSLTSFLSMGDLLSQPRIEMASDGTLITPEFKNIAGQARRWREVKPFLWLDDASGSYLGAAMRDGKVRWVSFDEVSPVAVWMPVAGWQSATWNLPVLLAALVVFFLTALMWPVAALVRRHFGKTLALQGTAQRWYRASKLVAIAHLLFAMSWLIAIVQLSRGIAAFSTALDGWLRLIQCVGAVAILGVLAVVMNAFYAWREPSGWWRRLHSIFLLLACVATIWFVISLHLMSVHLNY
jgi:hypothetical protein